MTAAKPSTAPRFATDADIPVVGAPTLTGWERRIQEHPNSSHLSRGQIQRLARKIHKRAQSMQYVDPDDLLRYVLTYADPTGETAIRNVRRHH